MLTLPMKIDVKHDTALHNLANIVTRSDCDGHTVITRYHCYCRRCEGYIITATADLPAFHAIATATTVTAPAVCSSKALTSRATATAVATTAASTTTTVIHCRV